MKQKFDRFDKKPQVIEVDRKLVPGIEWNSIQEAQEQTGIPDLEAKLADGQYIVWPEEKSYVMTVDTFRALCSWAENDDIEVAYTNPAENNLIFNRTANF